MFQVNILGIYRLKNVLNEHWQTRINEISLCWYIYDGLQKVVTTNNFSNFALCNYFLDNTLLILKKIFWLIFLQMITRIFLELVINKELQCCLEQLSGRHGMLSKKAKSLFKKGNP